MGGYSIDFKDGVACVVLEGRFDVQRFLDLISKVSSEEGYISDKRLWDLRKAQFDLSENKFNKLQARLKKEMEVLERSHYSQTMQSRWAC